MQLLNIFHVLLAIAMIALILVQRGAGATAGAAFGSGASGTVFGASGAGNFLTRATSVAALGFFVISMSMAVIASNMSKGVPEEDLGVVANDSVIVQPTGTQQLSTDDAQTTVPATDLPPTTEQQDTDSLNLVAPVIEEAVDAGETLLETGEEAIDEVIEEVANEGENPTS